MKKLSTILLVLSFLLLSPAKFSLAGPRYYGHEYGNYYRGYHQSYSYHHYPRYYHGDVFLSHLGIGLLAGAVVGSILYDPPRQQTVIYAAPPPPMVRYEPVVMSRPVAETAPRPDLVLRRVQVTERLVNIRSLPGLDSSVIGQAVAGQTIDVVGAAPEWLYVRTASGQNGWIMSRYTVELAGPAG
jgi:uncharacterized protein YgiM (DUF1202 family)